MNWGKGIVIGMVGFMAFILFLVINLMMHRVDLQSEDYYKREINYDQEISAIENSNSLDQKIKILPNNEYVVVQLPDSIEVSGVNIKFLRPDDQKLDRSYKIEGTKSFLIPKKDLQKGHYDLEISYTALSKNCLQKETIYI